MLELQEREKVVQQITSEKEELSPLIGELDRVLAEAESELEHARSQLKQAGLHRNELEGKIESYRVMQERRRQRLDTVKKAREASAIMAEIDLARSVLAQEEAEWLRTAGNVEQAEQRVSDAEARIEQIREEQEQQRREISEKLADLETRLKSARRAREKAAKGVKKPMLMRYERIIRGRAPLALYPMYEGACGHCFTAIPLNLRQELQYDGKLETCEACGVLIYYEHAEVTEQQ